MIDYGEQHEDHCRLSFMGENWWILAVGGNLVLLTNENAQKILDISAVRWKEYERAAKDMMRATRRRETADELTRGAGKADPNGAS